jgi:hypothetical protein
MAYLGFNDGSGYVALRGIIPAPGNRFRGFTPSQVPIGPSVAPLSTGRRTQWTYRTEFRVALELPFLSARTTMGESGTVRAGRLIAHLLRGGLVDVFVEDGVDVAGKLNCWLTEGAEPSLTLENPQDMLYTLSVSLSRGGDPFVALYGGLLP